MSYSFDKKVVEVLKNYGWTDIREINTKHFTKAMQKNGYPVLDEVVLFLKKYGDIRVLFPKDKYPGRLDDFDFYAVKAIDELYLEQVEAYQEQIQCRSLCLIGTAYREHLVLMMDEKGTLYGCHGSFLAKIGDSGEEAIETMILNRNFEILSKY